MSLGPLRLALLGLLAAVSAAAQPGGPGFSIPGYNEIQNNKTPVLPRRRRLNFVNGGCVDDVANASTDCTVSGSGGGAPVGAKYIVQACDPTLTAEELLTAGAGIASVEVAGDCGTLTLVTASQEASFLADGNTTALTCSGGQGAGSMQVLDDGTVQWCDGATTPRLRTSNYVINVKDYGAKGDSTTDDRAAIQAAFDAGGVGSHVFVPAAVDACTAVATPFACCTGIHAGTCKYKITTSPLLFYTSQTLEGETTGGSDAASNMGGAILFPTTAGQTVLQAKNKGVSRTDSTRFLNLGIDLSSAGNGALGIDLTHVNEAHVSRVVVLGTSANTGTVGLLIAANVATTSGGLGTRVEHSSFGFLDEGIQLRSTANANMIGPGNRITQNRVAGVMVRGQCGAPCTTSDTCEVGASDGVHADCGGCGSTTCSANLTGVSNNNRIFDNWFEANGTDLYDVAKSTIYTGNYNEGAALGHCSTTTTQLCQCDGPTAGGTCTTAPGQCPGSETCIDAPLALVKGFDTVLTDNFFLTRGEGVNQPDQIDVLLQGASGANGVRITVANNILRGVGGTQGQGVVEGTLGASGSNNTVARNVYEGLLNKVVLLATSRITWFDTTEGVLFASLPTSPGQGSMLLCTDCARTTPCTAGSAGANVFARYTGTQWDCHERPPGLNNQIVYNNGGNWGADNFFRWSQGSAGRVNIGDVLGGAASTVHLQNDFAVTGTQGVYEADLYNTGGATGPLWISRRSRATPGAGATQALASGDRLRSDLSFGHDGTAFGVAGASDAAYEVFAAEAFTTAAHGTDFSWENTLATTVKRCPKMRLTNAGALGLYEPQVGATCGVDRTFFKAQAQTADVTYTLPAAQGAASTFLQNDGTGVLSWQTAATAAYATVQEEGTGLTARTILNFIGPAITAADDAGNTRTNVTLTQTPGTGTSVVDSDRRVDTGTGLTGGNNLSANRSLAFDYTATPSITTLGAGQCVFSSDVSTANKGGIICEGGTAGDGFQTYIGVATPTADRTVTVPDAGGTVTVSSSQTNNALVKYSGTVGQVAPSACTESGTVIAGCTAPAVAHNLLSATHGDTNSGAAAPVTGDLVAANNGGPNKWDRFPVGSNDQHVIADSTQTKGLRWATPSWLAQLAFDGTGASFGWYPAGVQTGLLPPSTNTPANQIHCLPFAPTHTGTLGNLLITVTGGGGANCAIAVYTADTPANFLFPLTKLYGDSTAQDCSTLGGKQVSPAVTLTSGNLYWVCTWFQNSTPLRTATSAMLTPNVLGYSSDGSSPQTAWVLNKTFPASFTGSSWATSFSTLGSPSPAHNANEPIMLVNFSS